MILPIVSLYKFKTHNRKLEQGIKCALLGYALISLLNQGLTKDSKQRCLMLYEEDVSLVSNKKKETNGNL